jgi:RNA-binding protein Luc7-like 2
MSRRFRETPKSEMDMQREILDELMGINRNMDRDGDVINDYNDDRVCKFFLSGVCSHEMFVNTKCDDGPCDLVHSEELKEKFERDKDPFKYDTLIERDFLKRVEDIDRTIKRARGRVEEEKGEEGGDPNSHADILKIQAEVEKLTAEAELAGEDGNIDAAQEMMMMVEKLNSEKEDILNRIAEQRRQLLARTGVDVNKKLRVCDVCGSFLSIMDSDKRLADHFMGKQHIGFQLMRDQLEAIKIRRDERRAKDDDQRAKANAASAIEREEKDKERAKDREDRDKERDKDREGGEERDRERDRSRDRDDRGDRYRGDRFGLKLGLALGLRVGLELVSGNVIN